jgi:uncharacterized membrane protein
MNRINFKRTLPIKTWGPLLALMSGILLAGRPAQAQLPLTATLSGTVTAAADGQAIGGAKVFAGPISAQTDDQGHYSLVFPLGGDVTVKAVKDGYKSSTQTATLTAGQTTTLDFSLAKGDDEDENEHEDEASIKGKVVDADTQQAISGATVKAGSASTTTDNEGEFEIEDLAAGTLDLQASADGYLPSTQTVSLAEDQKLEVTISLHKQPVNPPPVTTGTVSGTVKAEGGAALSGATVKIGSVSTTTDAEGKYKLEHIQTGNAVVIAQADGYVTATQSATVNTDATTTVDFSLTAVPNPAPNKGTIRGTVVSDADGKAIEGATVQLGDRSAQTDANGEFTIENVDPDQATLHVSATGYESEDDTVTVAVGLNSVNTIRLTPTPAPPPAETGTLTGTVTSSAGGPVAGATVKVGSQTTTTDDQGKFTLNGVPTGAADVEVTKPGFQSGEVHVTINANATTNVDVQLVPKNSGGQNNGAGSITGTVFDASGNAVAGATVMLQGVRTTTDASGKFEFTGLNAGNYNLQVWANGFRHTHKKVALSAGQSLTADVTLHARETEADTDEGGDDNVGDATQDGKISVGDVIKLLRIALGLDGNIDAVTKARLDVAPSKAHGDFGDGKVDIRDAIKLLRFVSQLDLVIP